MFVGQELNNETWEQMLHEKRINQRVMNLVRKAQLNHRWIKELHDNNIKITTNTAATFTEKCLDQEMIAWYIQCMDKLYPHLKRICVDQKDEKLFSQID